MISNPDLVKRLDGLAVDCANGKGADADESARLFTKALVESYPQIRASLMTGFEIRKCQDCDTPLHTLCPNCNGLDVT